MARDQALKYAPIFGQLPEVVLTDLDSVTIHKGNELFGGGSRNFLIHSVQSDSYENDGILEETLVHEAAHASLEEYHVSSEGWLAAQSADPDFITTYAKENPLREDVPKSFLLYLALRHRPDRISADLANTIATTIPNRIAYFDAQNFDVSPVVFPGLDPDPALQMFRAVNGEVATRIANSEDWSGDPELSALFETVGALALVSDLDAALFTTQPRGVYPVVVDNKGESGVVLVEAYDTEAVTDGTARLVNVSGRSLVGTDDDVLVAGFVIGGTGTKTLLIRGVGATLRDSRCFGRSSTGRASERCQCHHRSKC